MKELEWENWVRLRAAKSRKRTLAQFNWAYSDICASSPVKVVDNEQDHGKFLIRLFKQSDVIWIGNQYSSGDEKHQANFKTREEWLEMEQILAGQLICPSTFKLGSVSRSNENVIARRFLVVESDELSKDEVGAVFLWLKQKVGLVLKAIVDTAGKSLHAWFDYPPDQVLKELKVVLPQLGCDPKLFTPSQPVRLPGAFREGKYQKLIYLESEVEQ